MLDAQRAISQKDAELARVNDALDERSHVAQAQKVDIIALSSQVETLRKRLTEAGEELKAVKQRRDAERVELRKATRELAEERGRVGDMGRRVAQLAESLVAQKTEAEVVGRRTLDLESRLGEQVSRASVSAFELKQLRNTLEESQKSESGVRAAIAELETRTSSAAEKLKTENAQLEAELDHTRKDRDRIAADLAHLKRDAEQNRATERVENTMLRERINDVAAQSLVSPRQWKDRTRRSTRSWRRKRRATTPPRSRRSHCMATADCAVKAVAVSPTVFERCRSRRDASLPRNRRRGTEVTTGAPKPPVRLTLLCGVPYIAAGPGG